MTDQEIRQLIESGVERSEIEYVMSLDYIGDAFQSQLLQLLADGNMDAYEGALTQLYEMDILKESDYERDYELSPEQEAQLNAALDYVMSLDRLPEINDKAMLQEYVQEHYENKETSISASLGLSSSEYSDWVEKMQRNASVGDEEWGKSLLYLCFDKSKLIGLLSIRYDLPEFLRKKYGDIGYGVRPSERNKGYATMMLQYALSVCRNKGMTKVILGCYKDNIASAKTIQKNGGILTEENNNYKEGKISQYYLINL